MIAVGVFGAWQPAVQNEPQRPEGPSSPGLVLNEDTLRTDPVTPQDPPQEQPPENPNDSNDSTQQLPETQPDAAEQPDQTPAPETIPPAETSPQQPAATTPSNSTSIGYSYVDELRAQNGRSPMTTSALLEASALEYSRMLANGCERLIHMDLGPLLEQSIDGRGINSVAENLAYNQTVTDALNGLRNSPGHYANMIGDYQYIGIGVVPGNPSSCPNRVYVVMQFAGVE